MVFVRDSITGQAISGLLITNVGTAESQLSDCVSVDFANPDDSAHEYTVTAGGGTDCWSGFDGTWLGGDFPAQPQGIVTLTVVEEVDTVTVQSDI